MNIDISQTLGMNLAMRQKIDKRTDWLFNSQREGVSRRIDEMFSYLMLIQWVFGVGISIWISPKSWEGSSYQIHMHVWAAVLLGLAIISLPVFLAIKRPGETLTRHTIAAGQMLTAALLIHLTSGRIETHFHIFGSLAFLAFYGDWRVIITASVVALIDHIVRGVFWPQSVFGVLTSSNWRWLEHGAWIVFEDIFLIIACLRNVKDTHDMANQQAQLEAANEVVEQKVIQRTAQLDRKNTELADKIDELKLSQRAMENKNKELAKKNDELVESYKKADRIFSALAEALPGTTLDGKYRLDEKIGAGGFGAVYRATHLSLNRPIAVKVFRPSEGNATMEDLDRFRLEGVTASRITHPNAVSVLDSGISTDGIAYLVMELLEGHALGDELYSEGRLTVQRAAEILLPVCSVLAEAHSKGLVHRDIKPDNIFLHRTKEGEVVKVVDFGIAKLMEEPEGTSLHNMKTVGSIIGTPTYMSPERLNNKPYDGRSDVYSLGIMMYEMLCGRVPFDPEFDGIAAVVMMHLSKNPQPLRELVPDIPEHIEMIVMRAVTKNPDDRPTAQELADEFSKILGVQQQLRATGTYSFVREIPQKTTLNFDPFDNTGSHKRTTGSLKRNTGKHDITEETEETEKAEETSLVAEET